MSQYTKAETNSCHLENNAQNSPDLTIHDDGHDYSATPISLGVCHV